MSVRLERGQRTSVLVPGLRSHALRSIVTEKNPRPGRHARSHSKHRYNNKQPLGATEAVASVTINLDMGQDPEDFEPAPFEEEYHCTDLSREPLQSILSD